jgi:type II secretory pathway component PulF
MPQFSYRARRRSGEVVQGVLDVADRPSAIAQLERLGLFPVFVDVAGKAAAAGSAPVVGEPGRGDRSAEVALPLPQSLRRLLERQRRPSLQELATFTEQMANLLKSGMPLTVALNSMTHLDSKGIPPSVARQLRQDVMEGRSLSDAMARQPVLFSEMYVNMVRAGEQSGALVEVLQRLAEHFHRFAEVQAKFKSALIYPAVVAGVGVVIIFVFMTFMLPKFTEIFISMKVPLPMSTRLLIGVSDLFGHYWWLMLLVLAGVWVVFVRFKSTPAGRRTVDAWKLRAPVVGRVIRLNLFGQFARTLATLLQNGVSVLAALRIVEEILPNVVLKEAIAQTREAVTDGKTIAEPLARGKVFPQLMIDLLRIGEETGDVPGALQNVADTFENELTISLRVLTNLIEPAMIIIMAVGVGLLLFSVLSAMFTITSNIGVTQR